MCGKFFCGMITGLAVGTALGMSAKCMTNKKDINRIKKKAKRLLSQVEDYVNDANPFA